MDDRVRPIDISTMQERVYQELRNALYQGRFMPGEVLTLRSLAVALGTSPMPVREAIQRLVSEKALVQMPNRTTRVAELTAGNFEQWTRIRVEVEGYAAQRAALRATAGLCAELRTINERFHAAVEAEDATGMLEGNQHFHFAVYRAAEADELLNIIESLWLRFGPILAFVRRLPGSKIMFDRGVLVHERVIAAMERRDAASARFALALDIRAAAAWFRRHYRFETTLGGKPSS
ncbi:GntR family transcriptional regulator [Dongia rigui]|uniref:GntR family transcriptional regulator n=1 Tax=Dongia rigui TaxID=940149 RepID=A0ABU5E2M9_9PROT|nr:GntR family transcriptional regulator [Dongia rigui]MDY0873835.1 GntR family transcriptional regulator [Dongia rigui]